MIVAALCGGFRRGQSAFADENGYACADWAPADQDCYRGTSTAAGCSLPWAAQLLPCGPPFFIRDGPYEVERLAGK
jgi:hypothetical protein